MHKLKILFVCLLLQLVIEDEIAEQNSMQIFVALFKRDNFEIPMMLH